MPIGNLHYLISGIHEMNNWQQTRNKQILKENKNQWIQEVWVKQLIQTKKIIINKITNKLMKEIRMITTDHQ